MELFSQRFGDLRLSGFAANRTSPGQAEDKNDKRGQTEKDNPHVRWSKSPERDKQRKQQQGDSSDNFLFFLPTSPEAGFAIPGLDNLLLRKTVFRLCDA